MTTKKTTTGKSQARKLKLKKETVKDLDVKGKANEVKGGLVPRSIVCGITQIKSCITVC